MTWRDAPRILVVRLDALGDVLMTTPAIRALRASGPPGRSITLLTSPSGAAVARLIPEIDAVLTYDAPWMKATAPRLDSATDRAFIDTLRAERFDAAVIATVYSQNPLSAALLCHLADIPLRLAHCRENAYGLLTDRVAEIEPATTIRHEAQRQLDLVATVGATTPDERFSLRVPDEARAAIRARLVALGYLNEPSTPWAIIHPGATASSRRYPPAQFADVAGRLGAAGFRLIFTGDAAEVALVESIRAAMPNPAASVALAGELSLAEFAALVELAPVLVSNNTGPVHIASAVGTPVVDLYALTNIQHTPWLVPHRVLYHDVPCKLCYKSVCPLGHHDCLRLVPPATVAAAALELARAGRSGVIPPFAFAGMSAR